MISRRHLAAGLLVRLSAAAALAWTGVACAQEPTKIRFTLDWKLQSIHAPFLMAQAKGYFAAEKLDVTIDQGEGSAATITRVMSGVYDAGFGDINAIIQNAATRPADAPVMVFMIYNSAPFAIVTKAGSPVKTIADLAGRKLGSPAGGAALRLLPALGAKNGLDTAKVDVVNMAPNLQEQMLIQGQVDASAVFSMTSYANFLGMKLDPEADFRWIIYREAGLDLYSNGVVVSQKLAREKPEAVRGLVRAIARAMQDMASDPAAAVESVTTREPLLNKAVETARLAYAMRTAIATPEVTRLGLGDVDDARLAANIDTIAAAYDLAKKPALGTIFDRSFLPPKSARMLATP